MLFDKPIQRHLRRSFWKVCNKLQVYQAVIYNKKGHAVTVRQHGRLIADELNAGHCWNSWLNVDGLPDLCQVDGQINVGEMQTIKLTASRSLVKQGLSITFSNLPWYQLRPWAWTVWTWQIMCVLLLPLNDWWKGLIYVIFCIFSRSDSFILSFF